MNMDDAKIEIQRLHGELAVQEREHDERLEWFAAELDFWRCKYLREHPERDNWDYIETARQEEGDT